MSGRFPGAENIREFWKNLTDGIDSITHFTEEQMLADGVDLESLRGEDAHVGAGGVLEDGDKFDAGFFGIYPKAATLMDPQSRVMLECAWHAFEDAGYKQDFYKGLVGVYVGQSMNSYMAANLLPNKDIVDWIDEFQMLVDNQADSTATKVSYKLNLKGPSVAVGTACSSSLVAVYQACLSLLTYQCDMALAGGVSVRVPQSRGHIFQEGGIRAPDGVCRPFDAKAQGMVSGNGIGLVVLKRLEEAIEDGDSIYAVIRGVAINNDGSDKVSYAAPSVNGQAEVISMAHAQAGINPDDITYIEAHGTATPLGDPIELAALTTAFRQGSDRNGYCGIGSVKSNIGHLDAAAGVTGLIKAALALHHKTIPPSIHFDTPNPELGLENSPFYIADKLQSWETDGRPRIAGVSSFGIGGTNVHAVLEEAPAAVERNSESDDLQLITVSARSANALDKAAANLADFLASAPDSSLADVARTLQQGRRDFKQRGFVVANSTESAAKALGKLKKGSGPAPKSGAEVVFMFPGQGSQYVNMGRELYQKYPLFRETVDACAAILEPKLGFDIRDVIYPPDPETEEESARQLRETSITQPAMFIVEYAMAKLWMSWGVLPTQMQGHSIGEYTAACLAGVFSLKDCLNLLASRGQLMADLPGGSMMAVPLGENDLIPLLTDDVAIGAINSPGNSVVAGPKEALEKFEAALKEQDIECRWLHTSHAFHSPMMEPMLEAFEAEFKKIKLNAPTMRIVSSPTGKELTEEEALSPRYWARHARETVRFSEGRQLLAEKPEQILLEVGPGNTLTSLARLGTPADSEQMAISSLGHALQEPDDVRNILDAVGQLWAAGVPIDFAAMHEDEGIRRVSLPGYPFERKRYWIDPPKKSSVVAASKPETATAVASSPEQQEQIPAIPVSAQTAPLNASTSAAAGTSAERLIRSQLALMNNQLAVLALAGRMKPSQPSRNGSDQVSK